MMKRKDEKKSGSATPMAVAAALAVLGISVGVDVQVAVSGAEETITSGQTKIDIDGSSKKSKQMKEALGARQGKVESRQNKAMDTLQQKIAPIPQGKLPAVQNKAEGVSK